MGRSRHIACAGLAALIAGSLLAASASAQQAGAKIVTPNELKLNPSPTGGGVLSAGAVGNAAQAGAVYAVYVKYPAGARSFPHTHPDQRVFTVISGTFYAGTGAEFDEKKLVALRPGTLMIMPANVVHYAWAKDGDVIVQEIGVGPSGTKIWPQGLK